MKVRPVLSGGNVRIQVEEFRGKQAFHKNLSVSEASGYLTSLMGTSFKQVQAETQAWSGQVLVSKKGKATIKLKKKTANVVGMSEENSATGAKAIEAAWKSGLSHNRKKRYILEEGIVVPFLVDLGVQTKDGIVINIMFP